MILGIIGGMGPLATATLFKKIIVKTKAECDQEHLKILVFNNTSIPDRTNAILNQGENPLDYLIDSAMLLEHAGADYLIMPCNTAHYYYSKIVENIKIPFLNMVEETVKYIALNYPSKKKVAVLATEGTCNAMIYDEYLSQQGLIAIKPDNKQQQFVSQLIYDIKNGKENPETKDYIETIKALKKMYVDVFILGCTELSVAHELYIKRCETFIDPMDIIATKAIQFAGKAIKPSEYLCI